MKIKNFLYRIKRRLIKHMYEVKVSLIKETKSSSYTFHDAREYWSNIPKSAGLEPWNSKKLLKLSDIDLIKKFNKERKRTYIKEERITGYKMILSELKKMKSPLIMDYGSGIGFYGLEVLDKIRESNVIFCDINESNLGVVNRIAQILKYKERMKTFLVKDEKSNDLHFNRKFDLILSMGVLHHSPFSKEIINNIKKYLKNNGVFIVMLYNKHYKKRLSLKKGISINNKTFGELTDPTRNGLVNPYSEDFDDIKATKLFGNDFELISSFYPTPDYNFYKFIFKPDS